MTIGSAYPDTPHTKLKKKYNKTLYEYAYPKDIIFRKKKMVYPKMYLKLKDDSLICIQFC